MDRVWPIELLQEELPSHNLDGFLVSGRENVHYLSGFTGDSSWVLVMPDRAWLITDFRYRERAEAEIYPDIRLLETKEDIPGVLERVCRKYKLKRIGFEGRYLDFAFYQELKARLKNRRLAPAGNLVEKLRITKNQDEIARIKAAARSISETVLRVTTSLYEGMTEKEVANIITATIRTKGGYPAFEPIVAVGKHSSQPHPAISNRKLGKGKILLVDCGTKLNQYNSDITRTFVLDTFPRRFKTLYRIICKAQKKAIAAIAPGVKAAEVDRQARYCLQEAGYGGYFGHALGHGVGLEVHEAPRISNRSKEVLEEGMIFTIEPGIYIPGWGGIRIEDMVQVTADGCVLLTEVPRDLETVVLPLRKIRRIS